MRTRTVLAISAAGPAAPSFRVRIEFFRQALLEHGVALESLPLFNQDEADQVRTLGPLVTAPLMARSHLRQWRLVRECRAGTALISRQASLSPLLTTERAVARHRRLVYDVDDAVWFSSRREAAGHPLAFLKRSREKARWLATRADTVIAGNVVLAEWLSAHAREVVVIPSVVDPVGAPRWHADRDESIIGWIGSHSTAPYLRNASEGLSRFARLMRPKRMRLLIVGGPAFPVRGMVTESIPWSEAAERAALKRIDVGLMPLPDNLWTRGKCAYKALQYMGAGIPVVASDVGITRSVVEGNDAGFVVTSTQGWVRAVQLLASDPGLRNTMGRAGRDAVEEHFSVRRWAPTLARVLSGTA